MGGAADPQEEDDSRPGNDRRTVAVAKQPKGELVVVVGFNYDVLEARVAEQAGSSAERIHSSGC
jgi:hypothetical protein